ncbi:hypothetical protein [Streptomyces sp. NPDC000888]
MFDIHCPRCPKQKAYPFRQVNKAEEAHIATTRGTDAAGYRRCQGKTTKGQCLWVQPQFNQRMGFSLPESFS